MPVLRVTLCALFLAGCDCAGTLDQTDAAPMPDGGDSGLHNDSQVPMHDAGPDAGPNCGTLHCD